MYSLEALRRLAASWSVTRIMRYLDTIDRWETNIIRGSQVHASAVRGILQRQLAWLSQNPQPQPTQAPTQHSTVM